jgi:hypothetical protein
VPFPQVNPSIGGGNYGYIPQDVRISAPNLPYAALRRARPALCCGCLVACFLTGNALVAGLSLLSLSLSTLSIDARDHSESILRPYVSRALLLPSSLRDGEGNPDSFPLRPPVFS